MEMQNQKNQMQNYPTQGYNSEDEIDLYDLVEILVKNKITIIVTTILITLISLGAALHVRSNNKLKFAQDISGIATDRFFINKANLIMEPVRLNELLENPEIQKTYFNNVELENFYKKSLGNGVDNYSSRKDFLNKIIKIDEITKDTLDNKKVIKNLAIVMELPKDQENLKNYLADGYIDLYEKESNQKLKEALDKKYSFVKVEKEKYEKELRGIEEQIQKLISEQPKELLANDSIVNVISTKYPVIFQKKNEVTELFARYSNELLGVEGALKEELNQKSIIKLSSVYSVPVKSKATLILAVGMVLGLFMGIFLAFIKEFVLGYKKRERKN